MAIICDSNRSK